MWRLPSSSAALPPGRRAARRWGSRSAAVERRLTSNCLLSGAAEQEFPQHHGIIMRFIAGREHERDPAVLRKHAQPTQLLAVLLNLRPITAPEFLPSVRIMAEPLSQLGAWRDVLHPLVDGGIGLFQPARP